MKFSLTNPYFPLRLENEEDKNKIINDFMFFEKKVKWEAQYTATEYERHIDLSMQEVKLETNYNWILGTAKINGPTVFRFFKDGSYYYFDTKTKLANKLFEEGLLPGNPKTTSDINSALERSGLLNNVIINQGKEIVPGAKLLLFDDNYDLKKQYSSDTDQYQYLCSIFVTKFINPDKIVPENKEEEYTENEIERLELSQYV